MTLATSPAPHSAVPLLLAGGLMNDHRVWDAVLAAWTPGRQVVVVRTDAWDTVEALAEATLASAPAGPFAIAGFSLGGYVALEVQRRVPSRVAGLALLDTSARADTEGARAMRQRMVAAVEGATTDFRQVASAFLPRVVHPSRIDDAGLAGLLLDMAREVGSAGFVRQQRAAMRRRDSLADLGAIRCPTLVLCGRDDQVTPPAWSEEMAAAIPDAQRVVVPECGHMSLLERPEAVAAAMSRWCAAVDASVR